MNGPPRFPSNFNTSVGRDHIEVQRPSDSFGTSAYLAQQPQEDLLATFRHALRREKWVVLAVLLLALGLVAAASFLMTPKYRATARIVFYRENEDVLGFKDIRGSVPEDSDYSVALDTQVRILESDTLALQVIRGMHLDQNPAFTGEAANAHRVEQSPLEADPQRREAMLKIFSNDLSVSKAKNTRVIEISFKSRDPRLAADVANALARTYVEQNFKTKFEATMQTSRWLTQQLSELQLKVQKSQEKLAEYQKEHGILGLDDKQNVITARLDDLNRELTAVEAERIQKEASYRLTLSQSAELVAKEEPDGLMEKLRAQEASLKSRYAELTTQLGPANPKVQEVENELKETENTIRTEIKKVSERIHNEYFASSTREQMIREALEKQKQRANQLNESAIEYSLLKRDVDSSRQLYDGLLEKLKEAGVSAGLRSSNIQVVDVAGIPALPSEPNILRNLALAGLLGLAAGIAAGLARERFDRTLRSTQQIRMVSSLPLLGIVPMISPKVLNRLGGSTRTPSLALPAKRARAHTIAVSNSVSLLAESYRAVLNAILMSDVTPPIVILVTSAVSQEGKTATSTNLAVIRARQNKRVLLLEADLRKPSIHNALGIAGANGLSTLLKMRQSLSATETAAAAQSLMVSIPDIPNLLVMPAGRLDSPEPELVTSEGIRELLDVWRNRFDHIIIDTPPVLMVSDTVQLSTQVDSVILVVRSGYTTQEAFWRAHELLAQVKAPLSGIVLNAADLRSPELSYYTDYGYKAYAR